MNEQTSVQFLVTVVGTDVPPDWANNVEQIVRGELALAFGSNATVQRTRYPFTSDVIG